MYAGSLPTEIRMIQVVNLLADRPLVDAWGVPLSSTPGGGEDERPAGRS